MLVMCSSPRTCELLSEYLRMLDRRRDKAEWGRRMMERRLRSYLSWKGKLNANRKEDHGASQTSRSAEVGAGDKASGPAGVNDGISEALKKKDALRKERNLNRRRIRGGAPGSSAGGRLNDTSRLAVGTPNSTVQENALSAKEREKLGILAGEGEMRVEADSIADL